MSEKPRVCAVCGAPINPAEGYTVYLGQEFCVLKKCYEQYEAEHPRKGAALDSFVEYFDENIGDC